MQSGSQVTFTCLGTVCGFEAIENELKDFKSKILKLKI